MAPWWPPVDIVPRPGEAELVTPAMTQDMYGLAHSAALR